MRSTVNLDCKTHYIDRNNEIPILIRVSINGDHDYINIGRKINIKHYDSLRKVVKSGVKGHTQLTSLIDDQKAKIRAILDDFEKRGEVGTFKKLKEAYCQETGKVKSDCFYDFVESTIKWERKNSPISPDTLDNYEAQLKKLKLYSKKLTIHDIDSTFLEEYRAYILNVLHQKPNTGFHAMSFLRKYTKKLFDDGKIKPNPFAKYKVGKNFESERDYLEPEELEKLHNLYESKKLLKVVKKAKSKHSKDFKIGIKYQEVLRYFLVSCYCGLRHSDIKSLRKEDFRGDAIVKEMKKGRLERKKTVRIPIRTKLYSLLDLNSVKVFENPVMETSQTNKYLKAIMKEAAINKHITFHCARHTFAIISLIKGVSIVVISNILGHSELSTTQRYAKVVDRIKNEQMNLWDDNETTNKLTKINCPKCEKFVLKIDTRLFALKKIPLKCTFCTHSFQHSLENKISNDKKS